MLLLHCQELLPTFLNWKYNYQNEKLKKKLLEGANSRTVLIGKRMGGYKDRIVEITHSEKYDKFTNMMMKEGNKVLAKSLMMQTLEAATIQRNTYTIFCQALKNYEPVIGLVPIFRDGHFYQGPMTTEFREKKHWWMLMPEKLSNKLLEAFHRQGPVSKKKLDMHKMAKANHSLVHYC
ncbi:unnamed protein product [Nyctereutes procyonoides]|uniref:(raccoon dog) hypothetical protein n=1 Tax=Nyctereutes procyonoides TaxID=34880 RepID=A0A811Z312_NYCPR|nr:unnamed protein product [Nyctereutes procyonoides]